MPMYLFYNGRRREERKDLDIVNGGANFHNLGFLGRGGGGETVVKLIEKWLRAVLPL